MAGIGPVPLAGLLLAEMGADVVRVERMREERVFSVPPEFDLDRHGRDILRLDLKRPEGRALLLRLAERVDVLMEGFRPGVMERLGAGPEAMLARNPRLVYGRMTGFGQEGPLAARAGHDLTYLALSGVLHAIGPKGGRPVPPLNLVADYGGGTMFLVTGILAALVERASTGRGQVVDAAMIDGAAMLAARFFAALSAGMWNDERGTNLLDSGAPFYDTYETADGGHVAVACLEPQFFAEFARLLPLDDRFARAQHDRSLWEEMRRAIAARLRQQSRDEWAAFFAGTDACVAPVLSLAEAPEHPHARARAQHVRIGPLTRPAPAPRFPGHERRPACGLRQTTVETILARFGIDGKETAALAAASVVAGYQPEDRA
jgi:alpha-methylacyl-CoA racemase